MALVGDLGSVDLGQVFQVLSQNQKDGVLDVFRGSNHSGLRFRKGAITLQFDRDLYEDRIVDLLQRRGRINEEKLRIAAANRSATNALLLDVLVQMKVLTAQEVQTLFRQRMAEEIYEMFSWTDARFEFHEGAKKLDGTVGEIDERLYFPADAVVMEAARRLDEWREIRARVRDDGEVMAPSVEELLPEDDLQASAFAIIDGLRSVGEVVSHLGRSPFEVNKTIARMADLGAIVAVPPSEYPTRGKEAMQSGRPAEAANLFDRASAARVGLPDSIGKAAEAWEATHHPAEAADRFVAYGDALLDAGRPKEALRAYKHAHDLVPTHLEAWKKEVFLGLEFEEKRPVLGRPMPTAHESGHALAEVLHEIGQGNLAIEVLERIFARSPRDLGAKRALVAALERGGDPKRLCQLLESIADDLAAEGDTVGAAASLQRVLRLDPERKELLSRIRELYRSEAVRRTRRRRIVVTTVSLALAAAIGLLFAAREHRATADFAALDLEPILKAGDYEGARKQLEAFVDNHPLTLAVSRAQKEIERVDALAQDALQIEARKAAAEKADLARKLAEASTLVRRADELARAGGLRESLAMLRKALALAPADWEKAGVAQQNASDLEKYLAGAAALARQAEIATANGDLDETRKRVRELVARHPLSQEARGAKLPFLVHSLPSGAEVETGGRVIGRTPVVVLVSAMFLPTEPKPEVVLRAPGYSPAKVAVDPASEDRIEVRLTREPAFTVEMPSVPTAPPASSGGSVLVGQNGGRVVSYGADASPVWSAKVSPDGELSSAPIVEPGRIYVVMSDGVVASLTPGEGHVSWRAPLGARVSVPASRSNDGILVATDDGRVHLVDSGSGSVRVAWSAGPRPSGGVVLVGSTIAVGTADGRIRLLDYRNAKADERYLTLAAKPAGLAVHRDVLFVAADDGTLMGFELPSGKALYKLAGGSIAWPRPLVSHGRILTDLSGRLVALDPRTGAVVATCPRASEPVGAPAATGSRLAAALRDGSIVALRADDLSVEWVWPGDGAAPGLAASDGVVFAVVGRKLFCFPLEP